MHPTRHPAARQPALFTPIGPWTPSHALGAGTVVILFAALAATIWPGWDWLRVLWAGT